MKKLILPTITILGIFILTSCGSDSTKNSTSTTTTVTANVSGEDVYKRTCIACHQPNGAGIPNTFPPVAQSDFIADREKTITQVIKGKSGELVVNGVKYNNVMPPQNLTDAEVAAVLTYIYSNFGNNGAPVTIDEIKAIRAKQ